MIYRNNRRGFTLVEILAAIGVIAILTAVIVPSIASYVHVAKRGKAESDAATVYQIANRLLVIYANDDDATNIIDTTDKLVTALSTQGIIVSASDKAPIIGDANITTIQLISSDSNYNVVIWVKFSNYGSDFYIEKP